MTAPIRVVLMIVLSLWLLCPLAEATSYRIHLYNGREFITNQVWEEGGQIQFSVPAGTMAVPKEAVQAIHTSDGTAKVRSTPAPTIPPMKPQASPLTAPSRHQIQTEAHERLDEGEVDADRLQKAALMTQLSEVRRAHLDAAAAKDRAAKQRTLEAMRQVSGQIYALEEVVRGKHQGVLPEWWHDSQ